MRMSFTQSDFVAKLGVAQFQSLYRQRLYSVLTRSFGRAPLLRGWKDFRVASKTNFDVTRIAANEIPYTAPLCNPNE